MSYRAIVRKQALLIKAKIVFFTRPKENKMKTREIRIAPKLFRSEKTVFCCCLVIVIIRIMHVMLVNKFRYISFFLGPKFGLQTEHVLCVCILRCFYHGTPTQFIWSKTKKNSYNIKPDDSRGELRFSSYYKSDRGGYTLYIIHISYSTFISVAQQYSSSNIHVIWTRNV